MYDRKRLLEALHTITVARRGAVVELDNARAEQLAAREPPNDEQLVQTLGALVRQLDNVIRELSDAIRTIDQQVRLLGREQPAGPRV